ncbi:uncharacterized protein BX664DRAFT_334258 [Halteromyces radiatus]|uniref:uncharacterized protein n=1 Tax=Halteromyces radiatus TaxID=101107 RepID=UPI00221ECEC3|nr:uncharacterized protein BX664DRAFT_334258 [Halteromyces radiatus]KAI8089932.1 hypothetical protein BX664DRAFT_334258 [Halteromyces radiatus]
MTDQEFPVINKRAAVVINDTHTEVLVTGFSDKIFIVVTQYGRIGSLIQTTLDISAHLAQNPASVPTTSQFLLGESIGPQSDLYRLYATSISQAIAAMNPNEKRPVLLGIALKPLDDMTQQRQTFHPIIDTIMANPVW